MAALGERGIRELIMILKNESQNTLKVRTSAAYGLSFVELTDPSIDKVIECLFSASKDRVPLVRREVLHSLGVLGKKSQEQLTYLRARSLLPFMCM